MARVASLAFALFLSCLCPVARAAKIFWVSEPIAPGEMALFYGGDLGGVRSVAIWPLEDGDPKSPRSGFPPAPSMVVSVPVQQATSSALKVPIPGAFAPGIFAVDEAGEKLLLNRPKPEWSQPERLLPGLAENEAVAGSEIEIFGRNFVLDVEEAAKRLVLLRESRTGRSTLIVPERAERYRLSVRLPENLPAGSYEIWVHNGHGGEWGWGGGATLVVKNAESWPSTLFDVREFGARGDGVSDDSAALRKALAAAEKAGGGIVYLPAGIYAVRESFFLPPKTLLEGDGKDFSWLKWPQNAPRSPSDLLPAVLYGSGQYSIEGLSLVVRNARRVLLDLSAVADRLLPLDRFEAEIPLAFRSNVATTPWETRDLFLRNVRIDYLPFAGAPSQEPQRDPQWSLGQWGLAGREDEELSLFLGGVRNVEISGCEFIGMRHRLLDLRNGRIVDNDFSNPMGAFSHTAVGGRHLAFLDNWVADGSVLQSHLDGCRFFIIAHNNFSDFGRGDRMAFAFRGEPLRGKWLRKGGLPVRWIPVERIQGTTISLRGARLVPGELRGAGVRIERPSGAESWIPVRDNAEQTILLAWPPEDGSTVPDWIETAGYLPPLLSAVSRSSGKELVLAEKIPADCTGLEAQIVSGRGAGQVRTVVQAEGDRLTVDRDWDVAPDSTSQILLHQLQGNGVFFGNEAEDPNGLFVGQSDLYDSVFDANTVRRSSGIWQSSGTFLQFLENVLDVAASYGEPPAGAPPLPAHGVLGVLAGGELGERFASPFELARGLVFRRNRLAFGHRIHVGPRAGANGLAAVVARDLVIDHNWIEHGAVGIELERGVRQAVISRNLFFDVAVPQQVGQATEVEVVPGP
ncbi:MAG: glycosyl hydrolase family 28-related protein [Candidatus Methylacidiphilaceae bacterium]